MKNKTIQTLGRVAIVVALLSLCLGAFAQERAGRHGARSRHGQVRGASGEWWNNPRTVEALGLDDGTRGLIDEEVHQTKLVMIDLKADVERANLELQHMLHAENPPPSSEIEDQVDAFVDAQGRIMREQILLRARILALLTPEQRADLETMHQRRRDDVRRDIRERKRQRVPEPTAEPQPPSDGMR